MLDNARPDPLWRPIDEVRLQSFRVTYDYPVIFTASAFAIDNRRLIDVLARRERNKRHRVAIFVDNGVLQAMPQLESRIARYFAAHAPQAELLGEPVEIAGGERCKNDPDTVSRLLDVLSQRAVDRHSYAIAIGGGAALDAVGYAAAIFHRGVRHVRLPTTVLAQCDSGVGVKNAVNAYGLKNLLGTFAPPWAIINDADFLAQLPPRELRAGMAEAVKVALIRDEDFFNWLEANADALARFSPEQLDRLIKGSAELHMRQIRLGGDPFENGSARPLDFGHWSAHKLEHLSDHALNHGEAVAIGVALDTRYSVLAGLLAEGEDVRVMRLLKRLGFHLWHPTLRHPQLLRGLQDFREHLGGELTITLLAALGQGVEVHHMRPELIGSSIDWLEQHA
jgi:3-dehydroquinate synthase